MGEHDRSRFRHTFRGPGAAGPGPRPDDAQRAALLNRMAVVGRQLDQPAPPRPTRPAAPLRTRPAAPRPPQTLTDAERGLARPPTAERGVDPPLLSSHSQRTPAPSAIPPPWSDARPAPQPTSRAGQRLAAPLLSVPEPPHALLPEVPPPPTEPPWTAPPLFTPSAPLDIPWSVPPSRPWTPIRRPGPMSPPPLRADEIIRQSVDWYEQRQRERGIPFADRLLESLPPPFGPFPPEPETVVIDTPIGPVTVPATRYVGRGRSPMQVLRDLSEDAVRESEEVREWMDRDADELHEIWQQHRRWVARNRVGLDLLGYGPAVDAIEDFLHFLLITGITFIHLGGGIYRFLLGLLPGILFLMDTLEVVLGLVAESGPRAMIERTTETEEQRIERERVHEARVEYLRSILESIEQAIDDWRDDYDSANPERRASMIGDLLGQIVADLLTARAVPPGARPLTPPGPTPVAVSVPIPSVARALVTPEGVVIAVPGPPMRVPIPAPPPVAGAALVGGAVAEGSLTERGLQRSALPENRPPSRLERARQRSGGGDDAGGGGSGGGGGGGLGTGGAGPSPRGQRVLPPARGGGPDPPRAGNPADRARLRHVHPDGPRDWSDPLAADAWAATQHEPRARVREYMTVGIAEVDIEIPQPGGGVRRETRRIGALNYAADARNRSPRVEQVLAEHTDDYVVGSQTLEVGTGATRRRPRATGDHAEIGLLEHIAHDLLDPDITDLPPGTRIRRIRIAASRAVCPTCQMTIAQAAERIGSALTDVAIEIVSPVAR